jgi:hypothetical protein
MPSSILNRDTAIKYKLPIKNLLNHSMPLDIKEKLLSSSSAMKHVIFVRCRPPTAPRFMKSTTCSEEANSKTSQMRTQSLVLFHSQCFGHSEGPCVSCLKQLVPLHECLACLQIPHRSSQISNPHHRKTDPCDK